MFMSSRSEKTSADSSPWLCRFFSSPENPRLPHRATHGRKGRSIKNDLEASYMRLDFSEFAFVGNRAKGYHRTVVHTRAIASVSGLTPSPSYRIYHSEYFVWMINQ